MASESLNSQEPELAEMCADVALRVRPDRFRLFAQRIDLQLTRLEDKWSAVAAPCSQRGPSPIRFRL